ncbi:hypothetical protein MesoLjLa_17570 [Mesorhizobium sp. L-2-11]|nr:hypothetical protein MesoLjLa_17570 [Mesorhizobium sp. L-2-11]
MRNPKGAADISSDRRYGAAARQMVGASGMRISQTASSCACRGTDDAAIAPKLAFICDCRMIA